MRDIAFNHLISCEDIKTLNKLLIRPLITIKIWEGVKDFSNRVNRERSFRSITTEEYIKFIKELTQNNLYNEKVVVNSELYISDSPHSLELKAPIDDVKDPMYYKKFQLD